MGADERYNVSLLNDYYGNLLTEHQRDMIRLYYDCDVSLNEIAEEYGISRQAVRDAIVRGEKTLNELESKLSLAKRGSRLVKELKEIAALVSDESVRSRIDTLIREEEGE